MTALGHLVVRGAMGCAGDPAPPAGDRPSAGTRSGDDAAEDVAGWGQPLGVRIDGGLEPCVRARLALEMCPRGSSCAVFSNLDSTLNGFYCVPVQGGQSADPCPWLSCPREKCGVLESAPLQPFCWP